jgi:hypothetical protein
MTVHRTVMDSLNPRGGGQAPGPEGDGPVMAR